MTETLCFLW